MKNHGNKALTLEQKTEVAQFLINKSKDDIVFHGQVLAASIKFGLSRRTVGNISTATKRQLHEGKAVIFEKTVYKQHKDKVVMDVEKIKTIPFKKRSTYRIIANEMGVSKSLMAKWVKEGLLKPHSNAIKPTLTPQNMLLRLNYSLSKLHYDRAQHIFEFNSMHNTVYIDEKWFYITKECERYYLLPGEEEPYRSCKSKRFITKIMFMSAVARPRYASNGECTFDGKIGIFPFTQLVPTQRNSKNGIKGTLETKPIEAITKEVIKDCVINKIILAIKTKWPLDASKDIIIQQDNAKPHIKANDTDFLLAARSDGFNIHIQNQPANSPDTNINDLGFFRSIRSLRQETPSYNVEGLVENVFRAFEEQTDENLNKVFLSLQNTLVEMMKCKGHNSIKIPHMGKDRLIREGTLPNNTQVDEALVKECIEYLRQDGNEIETPYDVSNLISNMGYSLNMAHVHVLFKV